METKKEVSEEVKKGINWKKVGLVIGGIVVAGGIGYYEGKTGAISALFKKKPVVGDTPADAVGTAVRETSKAVAETVANHIAGKSYVTSTSRPIIKR